MKDNGADISSEEISSLLRFYSESGLDFPISDEPFNRFEAEEKSALPTDIVSKPDSGNSKDTTTRSDGSEMIDMDPRKRQAEDRPPVASASAQISIPNDEVVAQAAMAAAAAQDLDNLKETVEAFEGCNLKRSARSTVFEGGNRSARIMIVSGCPSRDDDVTGTAMSGADGILLEKMLDAIGLSRHQDVYCGFCVPWSPPGGAAPTPIQLEICAPFLARQIELAAPELIVVMGNVAARHVLHSKQTVMQLRGKWTTLPNFEIKALAMFDPAMLRSQPRLKRAAWMDLLSIKSKLDEPKS